MQHTAARGTNSALAGVFRPVQRGRAGRGREGSGRTGEERASRGCGSGRSRALCWACGWNNGWARGWARAASFMVGVLLACTALSGAWAGEGLQGSGGGLNRGVGGDAAPASEVRRRALARVVGIQVERPEPRLTFKGKRKVQAEVSPAQGAGSGVIIDAGGFILTCAHVVEGSRTAWVLLDDDRELVGTVLATDGTSDLALLKVEGGVLPAFDLAARPSLTDGETVHVVARPGGAGPRFAEGTLADHRTYHLGHSQLEFYRRFSGQIEPGYSGGALVDSDGRLVGVLSVGAPEGKIGYAIAREFAIVALARLRAGPPVVWPWLGMAVESPKDPPGVLVWSVADGSPAQLAGIRKDDRLVTLDGKQIEDFFSAMLAILSRPVGSRFNLGILRGGGGAGAAPGPVDPGGAPAPSLKRVALISMLRPIEPMLPAIDLFEKLTGIRLRAREGKREGPGGLEVISVRSHVGEPRACYRVGSRLRAAVPGFGLVRTLEEGRTDQQVPIDSDRALGDALRASFLGGHIAAALICSTEERTETMLLSGERLRFPIL